MSARLAADALVLCAGTLGGASFEAKLRAAAAAGFDAVSVFVADVARAESEGRSLAELRARVDDLGLAVAEVDPLLDWVPGADAAGVRAEGAAFLGHGLDDFLRVAEGLGARSLNLALASDAALARDRLAAAFAAVCDRAAEHGLLVHLEFLPWTAVADVHAALSVVEAAGRSNGGVTFDCWHHVRGPRADARLDALAGERVLSLQLADAPRAAEPDPVDETLHRRRLPGDGDADPAGIVRALRAAGCRAPAGVEVFSDVLAALPPDEAARRAARAARATLAEAARR